MSTNSISLSEVQLQGETYFCIANVDKMRPFFMSIVSDSNHWLFIGSNGGLSAGRKNAESALFPYYTDDKIMESAEHTGSKSIFRVEKNGESVIWEPFSIRNTAKFHTSRNLYKSIYGNKVVFEEINHDLGLTFQYQWCSSNHFGFVRNSRLTNQADETVTVTMLDGLQNILPYGVGSALQQQSSNLADAYKRSELDPRSGLGIFALSAIIVDKAEPSEALKANIAWSYGLPNPTYLLSSLQLGNFREGKPLVQEVDVKAERGAYFVSDTLQLSAQATQGWAIVSNVNHSVAATMNLAERIASKGKALAKEVASDVQNGTDRLIRLNASSDALQLSNDSRKDARHFSNVLFNIMRGGIFDKGYHIEKQDFVAYLTHANKKVVADCHATIQQLPKTFTLEHLKKVGTASGNKAFRRLSMEYLPLMFSRRHGDPSRPWNRFSINTHDEETGAKILDYEGNWRDIFQNWEALGHAYPDFIEGMIFRFLNASTFDGYNPYRITKNGIDWERIEPDDPWSYIGYWGDHQIIYLLKFLEFAEKHYPNKLQSYCAEDVFVYANVPYRIKPYEALLENPKDTIDFDQATDEAIMQKWAVVGADSALLVNQQGNTVQVNFAEKLLATMLAKMSNFIPEGGIWMNTQRPEWNDANNALVGNGVSMVTLYYLIRFVKFAQKLFNQDQKVTVSSELKAFYETIQKVLESHKGALSGRLNDKVRKQILDGLGHAGSKYRQQVYTSSFSGEQRELSTVAIADFCGLCLQYLEHSLQANKRNDGLYHAYNLMTVENDEEVSVAYLSEMLEGQVAVLSSSILSPKEALHVLDALKTSILFRPDQYSYLLYPEKSLPGFFQKNNIPAATVEQSVLLQKLLESGNTQIIEKDKLGVFHFNGNFNNAKDLATALDALEQGEFAEWVQAERGQLLQAFEQVFNHKAFTGRSGTFFGYEGLGSIYWHMVSKLAVAVQECCIRAKEEGADAAIIGRLLEHYYEITSGIGIHKSPQLYGAFPTDPYSHTPKGKGAQQPGMTGQVKEDILCRFGELGVFVRGGKLIFSPDMLRKEEFLAEGKSFTYLDVTGETKQVSVEKGSLCFTYCQVPIVYRLADKNALAVTLKSGEVVHTETLQLDATNSQQVFQRTGEVVQIFADIAESILK